MAENKPKVEYIPGSGQDPEQLQMYAQVYGWEIIWPEKTHKDMQPNYLLGLVLVLVFVASIVMASGIHFYIDSRDKFYHMLIRITLPVLIAGWLMLVVILLSP